MTRIFCLATVFLLATTSAHADLLLPANYSARLLSAEEAYDPYLEPVVPQESPDRDRMARRRTMLQWHQGLGLAALGLTTAQVVLGQMLMNRQEAGFFDDRTQQLGDAHRNLAIASVTTYGASALLALTAPGIERDGPVDSVTIHKSLAVVHGLGMVLTPVLGFYERSQDEPSDVLRTTHKIAGYTTLAALWGAAIVIIWD